MKKRLRKKMYKKTMKWWNEKGFRIMSKYYGDLLEKRMNEEESFLSKLMKDMRDNVKRSYP